ncbi:nucleotidyltransferase family protein [Sphaerisporangium fuscum]|uniref:nucleotidyltransferase family protein n=1 Tax=Sphaerisporangium fuscum TaxID=2835868 RepID=UPI001BDC51F9|nr:nucleotidyltransferase family protein [Sphaerisporangium fuscum]
MRKRLLLAERLYGFQALRPVNDLDILLHPEDAVRIDQVMRALGFAQGKLSVDGKELVPFARRTQAFWRLNLTNLLPYVKASCREAV